MGNGSSGPVEVNPSSGLNPLDIRPSDILEPIVGCPTESPVYTNFCSTEKNDTISSVGFCTMYGSGGDKYRKEYCSKLGGSGEFTYAGGGAPCNYDDRDNKSISSKCGLPGEAAQCKRISFNGDPFGCCNRDYACTGKNELCFDDSTETKTCPIEYRSLNGQKCKEMMINYCTGEDLPFNSYQKWVSRWTENQKINGEIFEKPCYNSIYRNLYAGSRFACEKKGFIKSAKPTAEGIAYGKTLMTKMIKKYLDSGGDLVSIESSESSNELTDVITSICTNTPGLCNEALNSYCITVTNETLKRNPMLTKWCGCYMSQENYGKYTSLYGIGRECTPTCNLKGVIQLPSEDSFGVKKCTQNLCVIDDISINIAKSEFTGEGINFSQICNSCTSETNSGVCNCNITNGNFNIINSQLGNLEISQNCGLDSLCTKEIVDSAGMTKSVTVPCNGTETDLDPYLQLEKDNQESYESAIFLRNMIIISIFVLVIIIIMIVWYFSVSYVEKNTNKNVNIKTT